MRQAACRPGLLDPKRVDEPSAKLEVLMEQLAEIREEGYKALVFCQFTGLLAIVRRRLDREKVYLDGATTNRQAHVEAFQNDAACGRFPIGLKAGGPGLNLTAAEYVFLLDPWWNPAVEAQAVDRAHRIGQTRPVFAYRLIARDTVEEKVLQLQKTKRDLADAILSEDNRGTCNITRLAQKCPSDAQKPNERILQVQANTATVLLPIVVAAQFGYFCKFLNSLIGDLKSEDLELLLS